MKNINTTMKTPRHTTATIMIISLGKEHQKNPNSVQIFTAPTISYTSILPPNPTPVPVDAPHIILDEEVTQHQHTLIGTPIVSLHPQQQTHQRYAGAIDASSIMPPPVTYTTKQLKHVHTSFSPVTVQIHVDQTGALLVSSISGKKYLFILYNDDDNYMHTVSIPSRTKFQIL